MSLSLLTSTDDELLPDRMRRGLHVASLRLGIAEIRD